MVNRETKWRSGNKETRIMDMRDTYLINLIHYLRNHRNLEDEYIASLLRVVEHEAFVIRKLYRKFVNFAPIPFRRDDGDWAVWDTGRSRIMKLSNKDIDNSFEGLDNDIENNDIEIDDSEVNETIKELKSILNILE
jgi:hypothetical protein